MIVKDYYENPQIPPAGRKLYQGSEDRGISGREWRKRQTESVVGFYWTGINSESDMPLPQHKHLMLRQGFFLFLLPGQQFRHGAFA